MRRIEVRVAALIRRGGKLLLARHEKGDRAYWVLPGGRVKFLEPLSRALARELLEETAQKAKVGRLVMANDFVDRAGPRHVVNLYFEARLLGRSRRREFPGEKRLTALRYLSRAEIRKVRVRPRIKRQLLEYLEKGRLSMAYLGSR